MFAVVFTSGGVLTHDEDLTAVDGLQVLGDKFVRQFGEKPRIFQAPGRVNLIGEHTDYNDGFVMPAAVGFYTRVAAAPRTDRKLVVYSENFLEQVEISLGDLVPRGEHHWSDYVAGVAKMVEATGRSLGGANLLIYGIVPQGAGLSSSASLEVAVGAALIDLTGKPATSKELALLCQHAENEFVGARCGIMDQFVATHGERGKALMLDCRSLDYSLLRVPDEVRLVICNSMVRHSLAAGEYNKRRAECEEGVRILATRLPSVKALRDVNEADLLKFGAALPPVVERRCLHVVRENDRVVQAGSALERGNLTEFGSLMRQSHESLRDDFEVSCLELDLLVDLTVEMEGVYGARMTGGGFGGCTVNFVRAGCVERFKAEVTAGYQKATGKLAEIYVCSAADGVSRIV